MTLAKLCSEIAKREGKKSQAKIHDIREIVKIIRKLVKEDPSALIALMGNKWVNDYSQKL